MRQHDEEQPNEPCFRQRLVSDVQKHVLEQNYDFGKYPKRVGSHVKMAAVDERDVGCIHCNGCHINQEQQEDNEDSEFRQHLR